MKNIINTKHPNIWSSTDLAIASFLNLNFELIDLHNVEGNKFEFLFKDTPELHIAIEDFYSNKALVNPFNYFNSIKNLKSRLYSKR